MARSWRDYRPAENPDNSDNSDNSGGSEPQTGAFVPNVPFVTALPASIQDGLVALGTMAAPRLRHPERWPGVVADAHRLASDGWAAQALNLGWDVLDLFGAVPDPAGDPDADGLAVKLNGRRVLALCGSFATVEDQGRGRSYLHRGNTEGARLLWALHRGR